MSSEKESEKLILDFKLFDYQQTTIYTLKAKMDNTCEMDYAEEEYMGCESVSMKERLEDIHAAVEDIMEVMDYDDDAQYDDISYLMSDIEFHTECIRRTMPSDDKNVEELVRLLRVLNREMYAAKGALDCVQRELKDYAKHVYLMLESA